jgi:hypothetical protein
MSTRIHHHRWDLYPSKSLAVRGGLARTFGGLVSFLAVTFLCTGFYILDEAFENPLAHRRRPWSLLRSSSRWRPFCSSISSNRRARQARKPQDGRIVPTRTRERSFWRGYPAMRGAE